ncbi:MAG: flagellar basal body-associated FliL family protein [Treponema sp.]|jgi:flagellar FliL protein|nr:flagellar basal body-associated FliL family protein [Treponema sp.]
MSDKSEELNDIEEGEQQEDKEQKKKGGLASLLPKLLMFVAIGLGALIFIATVAVITVKIVTGGGQNQTGVAASSESWQGKRPDYQMFTSIGTIRTRTRDALPYSVVVDMVIGYDINDKNAQNELTSRLYELKDFVRSFFSGKSREELLPSNEARLKQEIVEALNTRVLDTSKARIVLFNQLDVMETQ